MTYALGLDSDRTFCHFLTAAAIFGVEVQPINLRQLAVRGSWRLVLPDDGTSWVTLNGERLSLEPDASYYWRPIDLSSVQATEEAALRWRGLIFGLSAWLEVIPGPVVNRPCGRSDNAAKPLHEYELARFGFTVPPSLTSADPARLAAFTVEAPTIVKALSGVRADARLVTAEELEQIHPAAGPIHLQRYIAGADVRAHVVGNAVFAELILAPVVDYRRSESNTTIRFESVELPNELATRLIEATAQFGLAFAGWDFKLDERGTYCAWKLIRCPVTRGTIVALADR